MIRAVYPIIKTGEQQSALIERPKTVKIQGLDPLRQGPVFIEKQQEVALGFLDRSDELI